MGEAQYRTTVELHCRLPDYYELAGVAGRLPSYFSHGWIPDTRHDYTVANYHQPGLAWFTFNEARDAMLFKLSINLSG